MTSEDAASAPQPSAAVRRTILSGPGARALPRNLTAVSAAAPPGAPPGRERRGRPPGARTPGEGDARPLVAAPTGDDTLGDADEELPVPPRTNDRP